MATHSRRVIPRLETMFPKKKMSLTICENCGYFRRTFCSCKIAGKCISDIERCPLNLN